MVIIKATAPTGYQLQSLAAFGMGYIKHPDGSLSASRAFTTIDDAKDYLKDRADSWANDKGLSEAELMALYSDIINEKMLTLDAVTAFIEVN